MTAQTEWPTGVIARYLTVGGATVDIAHGQLDRDSQPIELVTTCTGCLAADKSPTFYNERDNQADVWGTETYRPEWAESAARDWAQGHASTCRAMPKPPAA